MAYEWIGIGVTASGVIGALIYNANEQRQKRKSNYYAIYKDLITEYTNIERNVSVEIIENSYSTREELAPLGDKILEDAEKYRWEYLQFHEKIANLALSDIIPQSITQYYNDTFQTALLYLEMDFPDDDRHYENLRKWCKQENISKQEIKSKSDLPHSEPIVKNGITIYPNGIRVDSHGTIL